MTSTISDRNQLEQLIKREADGGIFLNILGFGSGNFQDGRMEHLSNTGNGVYAYIDSLREARKVLVEQAGAQLVTIAKDVKFQVFFNPEQVQAWRLNGYINRELKREDFNNDQVDAGDIGAGHQVTALYEIIPQGVSLAASVDPNPFTDEGVGPSCD